MKYVLFVCNHNAGRSQMAQAFFERLAPDDVRAESAGSNPARQVWPEVVEAMREVGIDLTGRKPKKLLPIEGHVRELVESKLDAIRSDPTAHRVRLQRLLPQLADEFEDNRSPEDIRACADAILSRFDDVPVRSHVLTIAHRLTSECLRQETCDMLTVA